MPVTRIDRGECYVKRDDILFNDYWVLRLVRHYRYNLLCNRLLFQPGSEQNRQQIKST